MTIHAQIFSLLVLLLPSQLGKHFWPDFSKVYGIRIDYLAPTLYATDILLLITILSWLAVSPAKITKKIFTYLIPLFALAALNISFSAYPTISLYFWLKSLEFSLLALYVTFNFHSAKRSLSRFIPLAIIYTAAIAAAELVRARSVNGLLYWLGERSFTIQTPGIALFNFAGRVMLRPYATFPHPNAMAGFALVSLILILHITKKSTVKKIAIALAMFLILVSLSQNAWLTAVIILMFYILKSKTAKHSFNSLLLVSLVTFSLLLSVIASRATPLTQSMSKSSQERMSLAAASGKIISNNPLAGTGLGTFTQMLPRAQSSLLESTRSRIWLIQPVHNIYLILISELGLPIALIILFAISEQLLKNSTDPQDSYMRFALYAILLTGVSDHYWLTLQSTQMLASIVIGLTLHKLLK